MDFEYISSLGVSLRLRPMSEEYRFQIEKAFPLPEPPFREVKLFGGGTEKIPLTVGTLRTIEEKQAWLEYSIEVEKVKKEYNAALTKAILRRHVIFEMPTNNDWEVEQQRDGVVVPQDPDSRRIHYLLTELLSGYIDVLAIVDQVVSFPRSSKEFLRDAEELFRRQMGLDPSPRRSDNVEEQLERVANVR